ncbi:unnamed protein product [Toxocara canis]|uniref:Midasin n=1 Tax=Toxocara canis TaxID=6265 RepID=A0A183UML5_TOXCA|nr:unnamed protein product [Toxocara canis]
MDSDSLEFDLETSKYGFGDSGNEEVAPRHTEKEKERENENVYEIDEGRPVVTTENEETESYQAPKEKTAEEVAREVDFFAADDEVQPISEDEEGESIVADTDPGENTESNEQLGRKMDEAQADRQTDDNLLDLSTVETFESDEELVKIDEMDEEENENDREKDEQTGDETNARTSGGRTHTELDDKPQIGDEQKEHEEKEKEAQEDGRTGESEGGSEVDANTEAVIGGSNGEDEKEAVSNEDDVKDSDEVSSSVLQLDRETDHRPWQPITYVTSTTPEIESAENEDEEGVYEEEEDDRIKLHDDTAAVPALDEWSSTNNLNDEEIIVLTTPTSLDGTADNNSVISNGTETVFQEFFNNFGVNHVSLTVYILGLAILACLLLLCVLCCIRKRETLCARCSGSNGRRDKNAHSNGINDSYKYTSANTQSLNVHPERERLNE